MTPGPGAVVLWWDRGELGLGLVAGEEKQRLRLIPERGKDVRVKPSRIALVVEEGWPVPGDDAAERQRNAARMSELDRRLRAAADAIEVPLLWEIVADASESPAEAPLGLASLADLALGADSGEARGAVLLALRSDGLHFVRKGDDWLPRDPEAVAALRSERERVARRDAERRELFAALPGAARGDGFRRRGTETERLYLDALEQVALHGDGAPEAARAAALEALRESGLRWTRPHEGAFRLLRGLGRFASDDENLQVPRFALRTAFPDAVVEHARARAAAGFDAEGRRDLTGLDALSIDSPHTREIDDLLSVEALPDGGRRVGVHIADPAAFVEPDDPVDREAASRGVSHYMPDLRIPMLPPALSEAAASLEAGRARPALSFLVDLDPEGEIAGFELVPAIVRSTRRLSYEEADRLAAGQDPVLAGLAEAGRLRRESRRRAGALVLDAPEVDVHLDASGRPVLERIPADSPARTAVSEAMVLAGALAARFCLEQGLPAIFRRQAPPAAAPDLPADGAWDPVAVRRVRRVLRRAEVGTAPGPHSALGLEAYVQASSPLRRYQDLAVHRQILARLRGERPPYDAEAIGRVAATTERAEADARRAEAAANEYWLLRYLEVRTGSELEATVVESQPRAIVLLDETFQELPVRGLEGLEAGRRVRLRVVRVEPRAGVLSLRPVD